MKPVNYDVNQALIKVKIAMENLQEVMSNPEKITEQERWALAFMYPFGTNITVQTKKVCEWVDEHFVNEED